jgi:hypothetical protein
MRRPFPHKRKDALENKRYFPATGAVSRVGKSGLKRFAVSQRAESKVNGELDPAYDARLSGVEL